MEEEGPSTNPREDKVIRFETPAIIPLAPEQDAQLSKALTSTSDKYGIDQYVNGLQVLANFSYTNL